MEIFMWMEIENDQVQRKMWLMVYLFRIVLQIVDNKLQNANTTGKVAGIVCWEVKQDNKCPHTSKPRCFSPFVVHII